MSAEDPIHSSRIVRQAVLCVTFLGLIFAVIGGYLLLKGFQSGELFVGGATTGLGGLLGIISSPRQQPQPPDVTISGQPPKVELTQPKPESEPKV